MALVSVAVADNNLHSQLDLQDRGFSPVLLVSTQTTKEDTCYTKVQKALNLDDNLIVVYIEDDTMLNLFEEYINSTCFQGKFNGFTNYFYYCKNDKKVINKIKESFPRIILKSNDFAFNFTLEADDVFVEHNDYVICLIFERWGLSG